MIVLLTCFFLPGFPSDIGWFACQWPLLRMKLYFTVYKP